MVSMTSLRGGSWAARVCCCSSQWCHCATYSRTSPNARPRAPGSEAPGVLRQGNRAIQQSLVQVVGDKPHPEVDQGALTEGRVLGAEAVQHQLPPLVHHGQLDRVPVADVTIGLQQRRQGQQPRVHRSLTSRLRAIALGQYVLKVCVEEFMAVLAQKPKNT